jgi:hypothetical protein
MALDLLDTYELAEAYTRGAFRPRVFGYLEMQQDPLRAYHLGTATPERPLRLGWAEGSRLVDLTGTTAGLPNVVSQRFVDALRCHTVTGWSTYPIELHDKDDKIIDGYYGLIVTGRSGPIQNERARPTLVRTPAGHMAKSWFGYYVDEASWDGSEIFVPQNTSFTFVVGRVKRLLEAAKLTNIALTSVTEIERIML